MRAARARGSIAATDEETGGRAAAGGGWRATSCRIACRPRDRPKTQRGRSGRCRFPDHMWRPSVIMLQQGRPVCRSETTPSFPGDRIPLLLPHHRFIITHPHPHPHPHPHHIHIPSTSTVLTSIHTSSHTTTTTPTTTPTTTTTIPTTTTTITPPSPPSRHRPRRHPHPHPLCHYVITTTGTPPSEAGLMPSGRSPAAGLGPPS